MPTARWLLWSAIAALVATPSSAALVEDGEFTSGWQTTPNHPSWQASGARQPGGGNPGAHYLVTHVHRPADAFSPHLASTSVFTGDPILPVFLDGEEGLIFRLELRGEDLAGTVPAEVVWAPVVVQGGRIFRSRILFSGSLPAGYQPIAVTVAAADLRAVDGAAPLTPDLSAGAPLVRTGFTLETIAPLAGLESRPVLLHVDNFVVDLNSPSLSLALTGTPRYWGGAADLQ
jgi:hypothetical protein